MKLISAPRLALCLFLIGAGLWLLGDPPSTCAEIKSATCGTKTIYCNAPTCVCTDGHGCIGYDSQWNRIPSETKLCSSGFGVIAGEESAN
jgi:hypothetical protein